MNTLAEMLQTLQMLLASPFNHGLMTFALKFIPYVIFFELPVYLFIMLGIVRYWLRQHDPAALNPHYTPKVSCLITCYSEGDDVALTIRSLAEQIYPGIIEIIPIVDGAIKNDHTYRAALKMEEYVRRRPNRVLRVVPKWQRGGRVSSLNTGLTLATGEIVMALDGDTSFDNTMVRAAVARFCDPDVVGVAGSLRVRNESKNLVTRFQSLEYMLSIHASKVGLSEFNVVNNISGAFGIFRKSFIQQIGGWDAGTAEDLDITMRIKNYFGRHSKLKIVFEPGAMGHTDGPDTWKGLFNQRLRWDGDLYYLYIRKHAMSFTPRLFGWKNFLMQLWTGVFFQLVMPFIILFYSMVVFTLFSLGFLLAVWVLVYLVYLGITSIFFLMYIGMLSERPAKDIRLAWLIPLVPFYTFALRMFNALATLKEMAMRSHLDSSMAPWWVLKRTKF
ncbi:MAG: glycosyltransferase [Desulfobacteraceae bacterium]|nr:glycosyltransferase [Desulfobacteraceae bacterium]